MNNADTNAAIIEGYLGLLDNLSPSNKLDLISRLSASIKTGLTDKRSASQQAFGAFESDNGADEIIDEIRSSRTFSRQIDEFRNSTLLAPTLPFIT
jgi:hypothetical protein